MPAPATVAFSSLSNGQWFQDPALTPTRVFAAMATCNTGSGPSVGTVVNALPLDTGIPVSYPPSYQVIPLPDASINL
jgi:hypothetical protein